MAGKPVQRKRRPSIKDVAALAQVSSKTVSNVLHGQIFVADATRSRVLRAIEELDYRPDPLARNLRSGRSGILAVAVPNVEVPFFAELTSRIVIAARARGYTVLIDETSGVREREVDLLTGIAPLLADGVIFSPQEISRSQLTSLLRRTARQTPVVLLGEHVIGLPVDHVLIDNVAAGADATRALIALGRRRVAAIGLPPGYDDPQEHADLRLQGYRQALEDAGLPYDPHLTVAAGARRSADGASAMTSLLALPEPPDAVFCMTDLLALGAVRALYEQGRSVPEDVAVIGFDNIAHTQFSVPTISTISPDKTAIAEAAVELILQRLAGSNKPPQVVEVRHDLIIRESTAGRRRPARRRR
ncbi:LacI family DNA-binding transcriptional regulator [Kribbella swartbergensis]